MAPQMLQKSRNSVPYCIHLYNISAFHPNYKFIVIIYVISCQNNANIIKDQVIATNLNAENIISVSYR